MLRLGGKTGDQGWPSPALFYGVALWGNLQPSVWPRRGRTQHDAPCGATTSGDGSRTLPARAIPATTPRAMPGTIARIPWTWPRRVATRHQPAPDMPSARPHRNEPPNRRMEAHRPDSDEAGLGGRADPASADDLRPRVPHRHDATMASPSSGVYFEGRAILYQNVAVCDRGFRESESFTSGGRVDMVSGGLIPVPFRC